MKIATAFSQKKTFPLTQAFIGAAILFGLSTPQACGAEPVTILATPEGVSFAILGAKPTAPRPTLFIFAMDGVTSLQDADYSQVGNILRQKGDFLCVSLDLPAHGGDTRPGELQGLKGWRPRLDRNEDFVAPFAARASAVLDYLIREHCTDPGRVAVAGTSRGGFMAFHFAAREPRIAAVVAFSPVTVLPALSEFKGLEEDPLTISMAAASLANRLGDRPVWIIIGNDDQRVGTDHCIAFARALVAASQKTGRISPIELRVLPSKGHQVPATSHQEAAAWLIEKLKPAGNSASP